MSGANNAQLQPRTLALQEWDAEFARLVKTTLLRPKDREATSAELAMFAEQVQRTGLDPFLNQIYGIYRFDKRAGGEVMRPQVAIDGFRLVAERTGKYLGQTPVTWCGPDGAWTDVWLKDGNPSAARVGVFKAGHREPTYAVAHWREYVDPNSPMWARMGANQLAKCAEALALRKCFPNELSGLYTPEEMAQADRAEPLFTADPEPAIEGEATDVKAIEAEALHTAKVDELAELIALVKSEADWKPQKVRLALSAAGATVESGQLKHAIRTLTPEGADELERELRRAVDAAVNEREAAKT